MNNLVVGTRSGVIVYEPQGDILRELHRGLDGREITALSATGLLVVAGTTDGIQRSLDSGLTWEDCGEGLAYRHVRALAYHPDVPENHFAGTEPAGIFISHDRGQTWRSCPEVEQLRDQYQWSLPYSPEAGCVRGFAILGTRAYAAVEVGGVLRSNDSGETWHLVEGSLRNAVVPDSPEPGVDPDVHSVSVHAWSRDVVYAATGGGVYRSTDGGQTWWRAREGYCRAAWLNPDDPQTIWIGPAGGIGRDGRMEASNDGGQTWVSASQGVDVPWPDAMVERFQQVGVDMAAVLSNGQMLYSHIAGPQWRRVLADRPGITAVCEVVA